MTDKKRINVKENGNNQQLTIRQRKLIQGVASGLPKRIAAIRAGYSERSAHAIADETLKNPKVKKALTELMEESGLSNSRLLEKHRELLNAQKIVSIVCGQEGNSATVEYTEVPDYAIQARALEMAYRLQGAFAPEKIMGVVEETHEQRIARLNIDPSMLA